MKHTIQKTKSGYWKLEWENGEYSIHSEEINAIKTAYYRIKQ